MERRHEDRTLSERLAIAETQILQVGIMFNRIEKDIHALSDKFENDEGNLSKRVSELEKDKYKIMGGWVVISAISMIILSAISIMEKLGVLK